MWFSPQLVWEIKGADLTVSSVHHAAIGLIHPSRGISIRFPRFIRSVLDRIPEECSTSADIVDMFHSQTRKMDVSGKEWVQNVVSCMNVILPAYNFWEASISFSPYYLSMVVLLDFELLPIGLWILSHHTKSLFGTEFRKSFFYKIILVVHFIGFITILHFSTTYSKKIIFHQKQKYAGRAVKFVWRRFSEIIFL